MSNTAAASSPAYNPIILFGIGLVAVLFALGITGYNIVAFGALIGLVVFVFFVRAPEFGVYATTALLLLQGSAGVLGIFNEDSPIAITAAQVVGAAAIGAWLTSTLLSRSSFRWNTPVAYLAAFCIWALLGTVLSPYAETLLPHWARMVFRLGLLVLAVNTLDTSHKIHRYVRVILICAIITSLVSVAQSILPTQRVTGMNWASATGGGGAYVDPESLQGEAAVRVAGQSGHSNWLAMTLILLLPLNAYWFQRTRRGWMKPVIIGATALELAVLVLTYTRLGFLALALVFSLLLMWRVIRVTPLRIFGVMLIGVVGFSALPDAYIERVFSPKQYVESQSVRSRLDLQSAATRYGVKNPVFGLGTGGFGMEYIHEGSETATQMRYVVENQGWQAVFIGTHNMYLQIFADMGVVGLALYLLFYYAMFRNLRRAHRRYVVAGDKTGVTMTTVLQICLVAFLFCAVFLHALHQPIWWIVAALAVAIPMHRIDFRRDPELIDVEPQDVAPGEHVLGPLRD